MHGENLSASASDLLNLGQARPAAPVREQVIARTLSRLEPGAADSELLQALFDEPSAAGGVGVVRHAVGAHAAGEGDCPVRLRRRRRASGSCRASRSSRAWPRGSPKNRRMPKRAGSGRPWRRRRPGVAVRGRRSRGEEPGPHGRPSAFRARCSQFVSAAWNCDELGCRSPEGSSRPEPVGIGERGEPVLAQALGDLQGEGELLLPLLRRPRAARSAADSCRLSLAAAEVCFEHAESWNGREVPLGVGVGEVRDAVRAHAAREGQGERSAAQCRRKAWTTGCSPLWSGASCATWRPGEPPHAETSSDRPARPVRERGASMRDRQSDFTRPMIAPRPITARGAGR